MNLLPWLLDWPPSRATVAAFLLLTAFSLGTLAVLGGVTDETADEDVTIESIDVAVRLNDDVDVPDTNGTVQTCLAVGPPGDSIGVVGDVTVDVPGERSVVGDRPLIVEVSLAHAEENSTATVSGTGRVTRDVFWVLDDDETLSVGDTARLRVRVRSEGETVASATRSITVENGSRSYDC